MCSLAEYDYFAFLPQQTPGSSIKYYFELVNEESGTTLIPENAPTTCFALETAYEADLNGDEKTDIFDLLALLKVISGSGANSGTGDINKDGKINIFDLLSLLESLGAK